MNKFYSVENNKIIELETVKDFDFMLKIKKGKVYKIIEDVPVPMGYEIKNMEIVQTAEFKADQERLKNITEAYQYLRDTDYKIIKQVEGVEDCPAKIKIKRQECRDIINGVVK